MGLIRSGAKAGIIALLLGLTGGCGDDEGAPDDPIGGPATPAQRSENAGEDSRPMSEVEARRAALIGWHRCLHTVKQRADETWTRYELAFKPESGRPRSRDIQPYFENITGARGRCSVGDRVAEAVPEAVRNAGVAFLKEADSLATSIEALREATADDEEGSKAKGGFAEVAEVGPAFRERYEAFQAAALALEGALGPARAGVDVEWMDELVAREGKKLQWRVVAAGVAARGLEACGDASPGDPACGSALEAFEAAREDLESYVKANPEERLSAFWLDVVRAKLPELARTASAAHKRKRNKVERFRIADQQKHEAAVDAALTGAMQAIDRVRYDFP